MKRAHVFGEVRADRLGFARRITFDGGRNLLEPLFKLAGDPRTVVEEIAGSSLVVNEAALVEVAIDRLENRDAAGGLLNR